MLHFDLFHSELDLDPLEIARIYDIVAGLKWERSNQAWEEVGLGTWDPDQKLIVSRGAGRSNAQNLIDYVRRQTGLTAKLEAKKLEKELAA